MSKTSESPIIHQLCAYCGSQDVVRDATAQWSLEAREWVLTGLNDTFTCCECERDNEGTTEVTVTGSEAFAARLPARFLQTHPDWLYLLTRRVFDEGDKGKPARWRWHSHTLDLTDKIPVIVHGSPEIRIGQHGIAAPLVSQTLLLANEDYDHGKNNEDPSLRGDGGADPAHPPAAGGCSALKR